MVASPLFQIFDLGKRAESHLIIWQAPRAGSMRRLLCSDWLPERARWSDTAAREDVGHTHTGKFLLHNLQCQTNCLVSVDVKRWTAISTKKRSIQGR